MGISVDGDPEGSELGAGLGTVDGSKDGSSVGLFDRSVSLFTTPLIGLPRGFEGFTLSTVPRMDVVKVQHFRWQMNPRGQGFLRLHF